VGASYRLFWLRCQVPSFDLDADLSDDRAYELLKNSPVTLFRRPEILDQVLGWLTEHNYRLIRLDASRWAAEADFHRDIPATLDFPDYYGQNLNAFNDCLRDVTTYEYGAARDTTGTVLLFLRYDDFTKREPYAAQSILDIVATQARDAMLFGHRMLCLVQSNDPTIEFDPVGAASVMWNPSEGTWASRR
jgi:Barstar (barnase inhibitor)